MSSGPREVWALGSPGAHDVAVVLIGQVTGAEGRVLDGVVQGLCLIAVHEAGVAARGGGAGDCHGQFQARLLNATRVGVRPRRVAIDDGVGVHFFFAPLTFLRFGLAFFAAGDALRAPAARMAPARSLETPSFFAICFCAAAKPMPFLAAISRTPASWGPGPPFWRPRHASHRR